MECCMNLVYEVNKKSSINNILVTDLHISTRLKNKLIRNKNILLNGIFVDTRTIVDLGDIITVVLDTTEDNSNIVPSQMPLDIIYEDSHLLVVNKPAGIPVHPSQSHFNNSLSNYVRYYFDNIGLNKKIRIVNRIDLNTSGLVVFAKNEYIQECLINQMNLNLFKKTYLAVVSGNMPNSVGFIDAPIARKANSIIERCISSSR